MVSRTVTKQRLSGLTVYQGDLSGSELILFSQVWSSGLNGYRTVNCTVDLFVDTAFSSIANNGALDLINIDPTWISGNGSTGTPLIVNDSTMQSNYELGAATGISQIGNLADTNLPITLNGTDITITADITYFLNGVSSAISAQTLSLLNFVTLSGNMTIGMFLTVSSGSGTLSIEVLSGQVETFSKTQIATINVVNGVVSSIVAVPYNRLGIYKLNAISRVITTDSLVLP